MQARLKRGLIITVSVLLGVLGIFNGSARAADDRTPRNNNIGFSVAAQIPNNQVNKKNSFFDIQLNAGARQTLKTTIYNTTNRDIRVRTAIHTAYTNQNGTIEYVTPAKQFDQSLQYKVSDLTKLMGPATVTVPANGTKVVSATVTMPRRAFDGVLLGGWYFKRVDQPVTGTVKNTTNVRNQYSYVLGLRYASGRTPAPDLKLATVRAGLANYHRGIIVTLRNVAAIMIPNAVIKTTVTNEDHETLFNNVTQKGVQFAPNTRFENPLLVGNRPLRAGRYRLHMLVKNKDHQWRFNRVFTITQADAQKYNHNSVDHPGLKTWQLVALGAVAMLLVVCLILLLYGLIKRRKASRS